MRLKEKVAVITGAGRGLGRAITLAMSEEGARITIVSRSLNELESVATQIGKQGGDCLICQGDISRQADVSRMVDETLKRYSTIDILVNNAAILGPARFLEDTNFEAWKKTLDINLNGPFYCTFSVVPTMIDNGGGKVINISSGLGQMPFPRFSAYSVSKAGIIQLTRSLSEELKEKNIQVNAIDPGVMDTSMQEQIRKLPPSVLGESLHRHFLEYKQTNALKNPARVADLVVFLASSSADHISGYIGTLTDFTRLGWKPEK